MIKSILLTGGTGFLGSRILKSLLDLDYNVIVLARKESNLDRIQNKKGCFKLFYIDKKLNNLDELFQKYSIEIIIHTATEYGRDSNASLVFETNLLFPIKLIEAGINNNLKCFINTDTFSSKTILNDIEYLRHYNISKKYFLNFLEGIQNQIKIVNLRLEHVFGEFDSENKFVNSVFNYLRRNEDELLLTDGLQKRDFIYIDDVVDAYIKVIEKKDEFLPFVEFEVGTGKSIEVRQFVETIAEINNSKTNLRFGVLPKRKGEIQDSFANIIPLKKIGWEPKYDLVKALNRMVELEKK